MVESVRVRIAVAVAVLFGCGGCRGGCSPPRAERRAAERVLAMFPLGARIVVSIDVERVRTSTLWQKLSAAVGAADDAADRRLLDDLVLRTGFDPFKQVQHIVAAFPEDAREAGAFGLVVRAQGLDRTRLLAYAKAEAEGTGRTLVSHDHAGRILWTSSGGDVAGFFVDDATFVLAGGGWADAMAGLPGPDARVSAAADAELVSLSERMIQLAPPANTTAPTPTPRSHAVWAAAIVPTATRRLLMSDGGDDVASSVMRMGAGVELGRGVDATVSIELGRDDDARRLVGRIERTLREAKQSPQALVLGLVPFLAGVTVRQEGPNVRVSLALDEAQAETLAERVVALTKLSRRGKPWRGSK